MGTGVSCGNTPSDWGNSPGEGRGNIHTLLSPPLPIMHQASQTIFPRPDAIWKRAREGQGLCMYRLGSQSGVGGTWPAEGNNRFPFTPFAKRIRQLFPEMVHAGNWSSRWASNVVQTGGQIVGLFYLLNLYLDCPGNFISPVQGGF